MSKLPSMVYEDKIKKTAQVAFGGLRHSLSCSDGELYDMKNMSCLEYPIMQPRKKRRIADSGNGTTGRTKFAIYADNGTMWKVEGVSRPGNTPAYYLVSSEWGIGVNLGETMKQWSFTRFGDRVLLLPEKWLVKTGLKITQYVSASSQLPELTENDAGTLYLTKGVTGTPSKYPVYRWTGTEWKYQEELIEPVEYTLEVTGVKLSDGTIFGEKATANTLSFTGISSMDGYPAVGDGVEISGLTQAPGNDKIAIIRELQISTSGNGKLVKQHPEMSLEEIKKIPNVLNDPVLVLKSRQSDSKRGNSRVVVFGSMKNTNGAPMLAVLDLRPVEGNLLIEDMQKVVSAYVKTGNPAGFLKNSEAMFVDKKRAARLLRSTGLQLRPGSLPPSGYIGSITYRGKNVNITGKQFSEFLQETKETGNDKITTIRNLNEDDLEALYGAARIPVKELLADTEGEGEVSLIVKNEDARNNKAHLEHMAAVIPTSADGWLVEKLKMNGLNVVVYESGNEAARQEAEAKENETEAEKTARAQAKEKRRKAARAVLTAQEGLTDMQKADIYSEMVESKDDNQIEKLIAAGMKWKDVSDILDKRGELSAGKSSTEWAAEFANWVDKKGYSDSRKEAIQEAFGSDSASFYNKMSAAGVSPDNALKVEKQARKLAGENDLSQKYKAQAIAESNLTDKEAYAALSAVYTSSGETLTAAQEAGIPGTVYAEFRAKESELSADKDENGKTISDSKKEKVIDLIDSLNLTAEQKDFLMEQQYKSFKWWQMPWN